MKLNPPSEQDLRSKSVEFGELTRHKTLIFDLDETLIHSTLITSKDEVVNKEFEITLANGVKYAIAIRPYIYQCLEHLSQYYEMAVFTAADQSYADQIIDRLDPEKKYI